MSAPAASRGQTLLREWKSATVSKMVLATAFHEAHASVTMAAKHVVRGAALVASGAVVTDCSSSEKLSTVEYFQQCSLELNCQDQWRVRLALRFAREVREVLEAFWHTALVSEHVRRLRSHDDTRPTAVNFAMYRELFLLVHQVLKSRAHTVHALSTASVPTAHTVNVLSTASVHSSHWRVHCECSMWTLCAWCRS
jgi:hypothetical protein